MSAKLAGHTVGLVATRMAICLAIALAGLAPGYAGEPGPVGNWKVSDGTSNVRIAECNGVMWGVLSWEKVPGLDKSNKDVSKRSRPTFGMPVILGMKRASGADHWEGQVYNAKNGKTYKSTMKLLSPDQLEVKGVCAVPLRRRHLDPRHNASRKRACRRATRGYGIAARGLHRRYLPGS